MAKQVKLQEVVREEPIMITKADGELYATLADGRKFRLQIPYNVTMLVMSNDKTLNALFRVWDNSETTQPANTNPAQ